MGCNSSSNSVHKPSKVPIKDKEPLSYQKPKSVSSTTTLVNIKDNLGKLSVSASESILVVRYDFSDGDTVLKRGELVRATEGTRGETYWIQISTNTSSLVYVPNSYLAISGSLQACE